MQKKEREQFEQDRLQVLLEFFETIIQSILYVREIYPATMFEKTVTRGINQITYTFKNEELREYISACVLSVKPWFKKKLVQSLVVNIVAPVENGNWKQMLLVEQFLFEISMHQEQISYAESSSMFSNLYWLLRDFYIKVHSCKNQHSDVYLQLSEQARENLSFKVQVVVKNNDLELNLMDKLDWLIAGNESENEQEQCIIIPIKSMQDSNIGLGIQLLVKQKR